MLRRSQPPLTLLLASRQGRRLKEQKASCLLSEIYNVPACREERGVNQGLGKVRSRRDLSPALKRDGQGQRRTRQTLVLSDGLAGFINIEFSTSLAKGEREGASPAANQVSILISGKDRLQDGLRKSSSRSLPQTLIFPTPV